MKKPTRTPRKRAGFPPRHAMAVTTDEREANLRRLRRAEGQIRGIQRMVETDRYCADILAQISAVQQALQGVSRELMRHHLRHCVQHAFADGGSQARAMEDELLTLTFSHLR